MHQLVLVALLAAAGCRLSTAATLPFPVYKPCSKLKGSGSDVGMCRQPVGQQQVNVAGAAQLLVDMRMPCEGAGVTCDENIDVRQPPLVPQWAGIKSCNVTLMPWSPFPCKYDPKHATGLPGQRTDYCYDKGTADSSLARNLTTNGYTTLYYGALPANFTQLCTGWTGGSSRVDKMLLTFDFRLASGRQFDRTYSFQIGNAVVGFGTCSEPSRRNSTDKRWSTTADVTYLQPYLNQDKDLPTRLRLDNLISNTYNVPIWASATLQLFYTPAAVETQPAVQGKPSDESSADESSKGTARRASKADIGETPTKAAASAASKAGAQQVSQPSGPLKPKVGVARRGSRKCGPTGAGRRAAADVPDEVLPLVPVGTGDEALSVLVGKGDSPAYWPNATFELPGSLSEAGDIYRAQVVVVPKANGCEEFYAMNPSGSQTVTTCGDLSVGEPYREVRIYVDGQLAGVAPIYYTMYTGGIDPRLWSAIVAHSTYMLPKYTFDLCPWLGALNARADSGSPHTIAVELFGASGSDWQVANTLLLWRAKGLGSRITALGGGPRVTLSPGLQKPVTSSCLGRNLTWDATCTVSLENRELSAEALINIGGQEWLAAARYSVGRYENVVAFNNTSGYASWRQVTAPYESSWSLSRLSSGQGLVSKWIRAQQASNAAASGDGSSTSSSSSGDGSSGGDGEGDGSSAIANGSPPKHARKSKDGGTWARSPRARSAAPGVFLSRDLRSYEWLNAGGISEGHVFELSANVTLLEPAIYATLDEISCAGGGGGGGKSIRRYAAAVREAAVVTSGEQRHYQRAVMLEIYGAPPRPGPPPANATHTVRFKSTVGSRSHRSSAAGGAGGGDGGAVRWQASCAWGAPRLIASDLKLAGGSSTGHRRASRKAP